MLRSKLFVQLSLAAVLAIATPLLADNSGSGSGKSDDTTHVDDNGGAATSAPAPPAATAPDDKGVDPAGKVDDKGVDPATKPDDKGVDPAAKPDDKGVDPAGKPDDKGVDPAAKPDDKGVDPAAKPDDKGVDATPDDHRAGDLSSTPDGDNLRAHGQFEIQRESEVEHLKVEIEAQVNDGTTFMVWVNGQPAATLTIRNGRDKFEIENEPGKAQPAGIFPVHEIKHIVVMSNTGAVVLNKDF